MNHKTLPIPEPNNYKPFPAKDDGYQTLIHLYVDGRPQTRKYTGKMLIDELPTYIANEYHNCKILVSSFMYYKYEETQMVNLNYHAIS